jgi:hemolysin activation/secretion protein
LAGNALPSSEQFFLGGEGSVRGYSVGAASGDSGTTLSLELHHPITGQSAGSEGQTFAANGFFFLDAGQVNLILPPQSVLAKSQTLSSVGWGANLFIGQHVSALATLAYALKKLPNEPRRYTASFQLNSQF